MKKVFPLLKIVTILFLLVSCSNKSDNEELPSQERVEFSNNEQNFRIIPLYEEVLNYTKEMKGAKSPDNKQVYIDSVIKPFQDIVSEEEIHMSNGYFSYFSPTNQIEKLEENTIKLLKNQELINSLIKESLLKSSQELGGTDKTIFIMPISPEDVFPIQNMEGVSGVALDENAVLINIDPSFSEEELKYVVAHEYHHTIRRENNELRKTLIDSFITEGGADVFARSIYPDKTPPWIQEPLTEESKAIILEGLKENLNTVDSATYTDFRMGNRVKEIPIWSTYRMGYLIVESYVDNHPDASLKEWTQLEAEAILKGSDYAFTE
ncbi:DUF2268 domain-containing protein [Rossellomorea vietnamensis]|uniref:DUF2268 domain-containing protein n=1 Tax=Rossellomorea vietnamensis TaxID=218284 RepID=UPI00077C246C|nr:DUF2268 domain-containing putative Zn-dependent protease [Rossellomorea vietnamensis]